jgi:hypothetical protein
MLITHLSAAISQKIIKTGKKCPKRIKAAMLLHHNSPTIGNQPVTLLNYTIHAIIFQMCEQHKITYSGIKKIPFSVKGATLWEHAYALADGTEFYSYELVTSFPSDGMNMLTRAIQEMMVDEGCNHCLFGGKKQEDEDFVCTFCRNDKIRKMLTEQLGDKVFRKSGWKIFSKQIGQEVSEALEDLARFNLKSKQSTKFLEQMSVIIQEASDSEKHGSYLGKEAEDLLFMNLHNSQDQDERYGEFDAEEDDE